GVRGMKSPDDHASALQEQGNGVLFVAVDNEFAGIITVADPIKESTPAAIDHLHELGLQIVMLTGDNERTARAVAKKLRIDQVEAGLRPEQKHDRVIQLRG